MLMTPLARMIMAFTPQHRPARRGLPHRRRPELGRDYGDDAREGQAAANRPALPRPARSPRWLPALPDVDAALPRRRPGRRRRLRHGLVRRSASATGVPGGPRRRVRPRRPVGGARRGANAARDRGRGPGPVRGAPTSATRRRTAQYDVVTAFECVHDLPEPGRRPDRDAARWCGAGGTVLVVDERVAETFTAPGDDVERLMYGYSLTCCLPDSDGPPGRLGRHRHGDAAVDAAPATPSRRRLPPASRCCPSSTKCPRSFSFPL